MDCNQAQISFSIEPGSCTFRLDRAVGVADAGVGRSDATQLDASVGQVFLSLRLGLGEQNNSLSAAAVPTAIQNWRQTAGLDVLPGEVMEGE